MPPKSSLAREMEEMPGHRPTWDFFEMGTTTRMGRGLSAGEQNNKKRALGHGKRVGKRRRRTRRYITSNIVGGKVERKREIKEEMMTVSVFSFVPLSVHCLLPPPSWATGKWGVFLVLFGPPPPDDR